MSVYVNIGRITAPHGVRGWVKVFPLTDNPNRFDSLTNVFAAAQDGTSRRRIEIEDVRYHADRIAVKLKDVETREQAAGLKGLMLQVPERDVPPIAEADTYYIYQLEGMKVYDEGGALLGTLEHVFQTGSNDVYVVRAPHGKYGKHGKGEFMVPALKKCIRRVDVENKIMVVDREWVT